MLSGRLRHVHGKGTSTESVDATRIPWDASGVDPRDFAGAKSFRGAADTWPVRQDVDPVALSAAWVQFGIAREVWREIESGRQSLQSIGGHLGQSAESQRKKLTGEQAGSLRDLLGWCMLAGPEAAKALPRSDADYFPPTYADRVFGWTGGEWQLPNLGTRDDIDWLDIAQQVTGAQETRHELGIAELASADVIAVDVAAALVPRFVAKGDIRQQETGTSSAVTLAIGAVHPVWIGVTKVAPLERATPAQAHSEVHRLRAFVREVVERGSGALVICYANLADPLVTQALGIDESSDPSDAVMGPFETAVGADPWWSEHAVNVRAVTRTGSATHRVAVLPLLKVVDI